MQFERRMVSLLILLALLGAPALGLRLLCAGHSCDEPVRSTATIPFCSLDKGVRDLIVGGFREGRSPDVLAVAAQPVAGGSYFEDNGPRPAWLSATAAASTRVPIALRGPGGAETGESLPAGTGLDDIAPTLAAYMHLRRPHPEVRSGTPVSQAIGDEDRVPLVLQIVWKGVGSDELEEHAEAWPTARRLVEDFGTMDGTTGSLPADPAAVLTTIGTGGTPAQHGITGALVRDDLGQLREAWGDKAPISVIAGWGDDLDELTDQRARVGMVANDPTDRGLVGGDWYVTHDDDDFTLAERPGAVVQEVANLLDKGYGSDATPDLLAVTLERPIATMDRVTERIIEQAVAAVGHDDLAIAFSATGGAADADAIPARRVVKQVERTLPPSGRVVLASTPGGLYLDQNLIAEEAIEDDEIIEALERVSDASGAPVFRDVFPAIAVSFGRYC